MAEFNSTAIYGDLTVTGKTKIRGGHESGLDADMLDGHHWSEIDTAVSPANILTKLKTVDGTGSGLDADLFHGYNTSDFVSSRLLSNFGTAAPDTISDTRGVSFKYLTGGAPNKPTGTDHALMTMAYNSSYQSQMAADWRTNNWYVREQNNGTWGGWDKIWTSGNDGAGSLLDADKLDGLQANQFLRKDINQTFTGNLDITSEIYGHSSLMHAKYYRQYDYDDGYNSSNYIQSYVRGNSWNWRGYGTADNFTMLINGNKVWNSGNDGNGSGLDADKLDGHHWAEIDTAVSPRSILTKIKSVDGSGSGLDADTLDGKHWSDIDTAVSSSNILTKLKSVDGSGSGLDADLLDGLQASQFLKSNNVGHGSGLDADTVDGLHAAYIVQGNGINRNTQTSNLDASTLRKSGFYTGHQFHPTNDPNTRAVLGNYGQIIHVPFYEDGSSSNYDSQLGFDHDANEMYLRKRFGNGIWGTWARMWHSGNDGSGSGLDADKLDGLQASQFLRNDQAQTINGDFAINPGGGGGGSFHFHHGNEFNAMTDTSGPTDMYINFRGGNTKIGTGSTKSNLYVGNEIYAKDNQKVWHAGNDGSGSGLDADKLDGLQASQFLRSNVSDTMNGTLTMNGYIGRSGHSKGYMLGSYNTVAANHDKTNPIYTIGSNYKPSDTSLNNMYGIGFTSAGNAGFLSGAKSAGASSWGMYVCSAGSAKVFLDAGNGRIWCRSHIVAGGNITGAKVYNAVFNDYAELFETPEKENGMKMEPGDILMLDLESEKETDTYVLCNEECSTLAIGVVSDDYAQLIGGKETVDGKDLVESNEHDHEPVGLMGRVRPKITGPISKGDFVVSSKIPGVGRKFIQGVDNQLGILGMALANKSSKKIERVRMIIKR